jgi:hypothetical protein
MPEVDAMELGRARRCWSSCCEVGEGRRVGGELVAAVRGAEPPGAALVIGAVRAGGLDGHAADGVGGHGRELVELAVLQPEDAVGDLAKPVVVRDDDDASAVVLRQPAELPGDVATVGGVEVGGRFVGEDDGGVVGQGASDGDALLLAAGELVWPEPQPLSEPQARQEVGGPLAGGAAVDADQVAGQLDVLQRRPGRRAG